MGAADDVDGPDEEFDYHLERGSELLGRGEVEPAREHLERALGLRPSSPQALGLLGQALYRQGFFEQAAVAWLRLVEVSPAEAGARVNLGLAFLKARRFPDAVRQLEIALDLNPGHHKAMGYLGLALLESGDPARARGWFEKAGSEQLVARCDERLEALAAAEPPAPAPGPPSAQALGPLLGSPAEEAVAAPDGPVGPAEEAAGAAGAGQAADEWTSAVGAPEVPPEEPPLIPEEAAEAAWPGEGPGLDLPPVAEWQVDEATMGGWGVEPSTAAPAPGAVPAGPSPPGAASGWVSTAEAEPPAPEPVPHTAPTLADWAARRVVAPPVGEPFAAGAGGLSVAVRGALCCRLAGLAAWRGSLTFDGEVKRFRGRITDKPFGEGPDRMHRVTGDGLLVLRDPSSRFTVIDLAGEAGYFREAVVFGFEESVGYENGRIAAGGADLDLVHLLGQGRVVLRTGGDPVALEVTAAAPVRVPAAALVGWTGGLTPRLAPLLDGEVGGAVEVAGEGRVLVDAGPATAQAGAEAR